FQAYINRLARFSGLRVEQAIALLPSDKKEWEFWSGAPEERREEWRGYEGYFKSQDEVGRFLSGLRRHVE
ncbi:MAG: hypothetical protein ACRD4B_04005, partial [Acidobacteriota bacterium]